MINISRIYESIISEGKHWPEDYIKTGFNMIKNSELGNQSWYSDNYIRQDLKTIADEFDPLSHKNSNLGYFSPIIRWFIEFSGKDKSKYQEFIERKLNKIIQGLQLIVNDTSLEGKWKDKIKKDLPFSEFENIVNTELEKIKSSDASKRGKTYGKSDYEIIPIDSYKELHKKFGGNRTGYEGESEWCHTNRESTYGSWTDNGTKAFFVLAKNGWENIKPPNPETTNAYDNYGTSLIAILVNVSDNELLNATLRWNHVIEPSETKPKTTVDKAFLGWGDLDETVQMNIEKEVAKILEEKKLDLKRKIDETNKKVERLLKNAGDEIDNESIPDKYKNIITEIKIPNSIVDIMPFTFENSTKLTSVTMPNSIKSIGDSAFANCKKLKSINIPDSVNKIDSWAFLNCPSLTSITIPDSITEIKLGTFIGCKSLTSIIIPDNVIKIEAYAFESCIGLTSITIPNSVKEINRGAFRFCKNLTSVIIGNSVKDIGPEAFLQAEALTSIIIPNSVTSIGEMAFLSCPNLTITFQKGFDRSILKEESFNPSCKFIFEE